MVSIAFMVNFYYIYGWYYIYGFYYIYGWYRANLNWACDDVVAYFSSSGRFQLTAWQRNENFKLWTHFFHLGSKGHNPQESEQINV